MGDVKRIAITFNGHLPVKDMAAAIDRSFVRELQPRLLDKEHFEAFYRLDDECQTKDIRPDVFCFPPTLDSLKKITESIRNKYKDDPNVEVFTLIHGHGHKGYFSGGSGQELAQILGTLPASISRITILHQCFAGGFTAYDLVDENDLLWAYSGADEVNWGDASHLAILQTGKDANGDGVYSLQEIFWKGQSYIYNKFAPLYRRFVFERGAHFIDRGLGTTPALPPFPATPTTVSDVSDYLKKTKLGGEEGITIIGFEGAKQGNALKRMLETEAITQNGTTQFLWIPIGLGRVLTLSEEARSLEEGSFYKVFYVGGNEGKMFGTEENVHEVLTKIYRGEKLENKK